MRCDVCSWGGLEFRFSAGSPLIPNADYIRSDCHRAVWVVAYDWQGRVTLKTSAGLTVDLGPRSATNWGGVRFCLDGTFHVLVTAPNGGKHTGRVFAVSVDGSQFLGQTGGYTVDPAKSPDILDINEDGISRPMNMYQRIEAKLDHVIECLHAKATEPPTCPRCFWVHNEAVPECPVPQEVS